MALTLIASTFASCSPCFDCAFSGPKINRSGSIFLENGEYLVSFTNAAVHEIVATHEGQQFSVVSQDWAVTEISVERVSPMPLTENDATAAYEAADKFCRSLLRQSLSPEERPKGFFRIARERWVFQEACL
jgi:hypothetical protein